MFGTGGERTAGVEGSSFDGGDKQTVKIRCSGAPLRSGEFYELVERLCQQHEEELAQLREQMQLDSHAASPKEIVAGGRNSDGHRTLQETLGNGPNTLSIVRQEPPSLSIDVNKDRRSNRIPSTCSKITQQSFQQARDADEISKLKEAKTHSMIRVTMLQGATVHPVDDPNVPTHPCDAPTPCEAPPLFTESHCASHPSVDSSDAPTRMTSDGMDVVEPHMLQARLSARPSRSIGIDPPPFLDAQHCDNGNLVLPRGQKRFSAVRLSDCDGHVADRHSRNSLRKNTLSYREKDSLVHVFGKSFDGEDSDAGAVRIRHSTSGDARSARAGGRRDSISVAQLRKERKQKRDSDRDFLSAADENEQVMETEEFKVETQAETTEIELGIHQDWERVTQAEIDSPQQGTPQHAQFKQNAKARNTSNIVAMSNLTKVNQTCSQRCVSDPASKSRLAWDIAGVIILTQDMIIIPLQVYFDHSEFEFLSILRFVVGIFWSVDLLASFFVGYHTKGSVEMRPRKIAIYYLKGWFLCDFLLVLLDWMDVLMGTVAETRAIRAVKGTRGLRALKLLRLAKFRQMLHLLFDRVTSEHKRTLLNVLKTILFIIVVNHFIACGFYGLHGVTKDYLHVDHDNTWVDKNFNDGDGMPYRYTTSMHWSLTQFTPASMEVQPVNTLERSYTIFVLLFALVTFSSFVSSITAAMTHLRNINAKKIEEDASLLKYLSEHRISAELTSRVLHFFQERAQQQHRLARTKEQDVDLLRVLPESLKFELRTESYYPSLQVHQLFQRHFDLEPTGKTFTASSCTEKRIDYRDELYGHGREVTHMVFVLDGVLTYEYPLGNIIITENVVNQQWCCEIALWANLPIESYPFVAQTNTELLLLSGKDLRQHAIKNPMGSKILASYAESFMQSAVQVASRCPSQCVVMSDTDFVHEIAQRIYEDVTQQGEHAHASHYHKGNSVFSSNSRFASFVGTAPDDHGEGRCHSDKSTRNSKGKRRVTWKGSFMQRLSRMSMRSKGDHPHLQPL